jgi:membrane protein YdbS with pleckstrin-like domain
MRKWISYVAMTLLFFAINLLLTYFKEDYWDFKGSLAVGVLFLVILLVLDGIALYFRKRKGKQ